MKRASGKTKLVVGGFILTLILASILGVIALGDKIGLLKSRTSYTAAFKNTNGLRAGATVRMGGVDIGTVDAISIEQRDGAAATLAKISIYSPNDDLVRVESQVSLETQGVLGDKFVMLYPGPYTAPRLEAGALIPIKERPELDTVMAKSTGIIDNVSAVSTRMEQFANTLPDAKTMNAMTNDMRASVTEMRRFLASLNSDDTIFAAMKDQKASQQLKDTLARLDRTSANLESITAKIDKGQGTLGALVNDTGLYDDMRNLLGRANRSKVARFMIRQTLEGNEDEKMTH